MFEQIVKFFPIILSFGLVISIITLSIMIEKDNKKK